MAKGNHCQNCAYAHCNKSGCGKTYYCLKEKANVETSYGVPYKRVKPLDICKKYKSRGK